MPIQDEDEELQGLNSFCLETKTSLPSFLGVLGLSCCVAAAAKAAGDAKEEEGRRERGRSEVKTKKWLLRFSLKEK